MQHVKENAKFFDIPNFWGPKFLRTRVFYLLMDRWANGPTLTVLIIYEFFVLNIIAHFESI